MPCILAGVATVTFNQSETSPDLSRLNDSERRVLSLLAEGHTAKTVARELNLTPAAVNERLREARRKAGVGSSRELARLLKSQENRHEQMGMGKPATASSEAISSDAKPWRSRTGVIAMVSLLVVAAATAAALTGQINPPQAQVDPLLGTPLQTGPDPAALHAQVRAESRDPSWASTTEAAIRARATQIPLIGKDGNTLRVTCASKLCEIAGSIQMSAKASAEYDPKLPESRAQAALQSNPFVDDISRLGLKSESGLFTGPRDKDDQIVFMLYYSRVK